MNRAINTASTIPVLTPGDIKSRLVIDFNDDDELITSLVAAAADWAEQYMGISVMSQAWDYYYDGFSDLIIQDKNVSAVVVKYFDENNIEQTLAANQYWTNFISYPAKLTAVSSWPSYYSRPNPVKIEVTAGYSLASSVPDAIKTGIALIVGHLYNNRENTTPVQLNELPMGAKSFLDKYRVTL